VWNNPDALNRLSGLILLATALFAVWLGGRAFLDARFPFRAVKVTGTAHAETRQAARALIPGLAGGFFSMNLAVVRTGFERLPWVRHADVRRQWPGRLEIALEEHRPAAAWNDRAMLNLQGELFPVEPAPGLPRFYAPDGMEQEVARQYAEFVNIVAPLGVKVEQMVVSRRMSWRVRLSNGISVVLGRERMNERLTRFVRFYPQASAALGGITRADMRYPNGFAAHGEGQRKQPA